MSPFPVAGRWSTVIDTDVLRYSYGRTNATGTGVLRLRAYCGYGYGCTMATAMSVLRQDYGCGDSTLMFTAYTVYYITRQMFNIIGASLSEWKRSVKHMLGDCRK